MCASRWPAIWPQVVAISLIGLGAASCSDSGRFSDTFGSASPPPSEVTGSIPAQPATNRMVSSRPLPPIASADAQGVSGGGRGMGSYQPQNSEITGSVHQAPPPPPPPTWSWDGGIAITVAPGETLETIAHRHGVPVAVIMRANHISNPAAVHVGQHLVIPRYRSAPVMAYAPPATRVATVPDHLGTPRAVSATGSEMHVVTAGETLNSIARLYRKPVGELAKANNISLYTRVRVGEHIVIPGASTKQRAEAAPPPAPPPPHRDVAAIKESPHSAWNAVPVAPPPQQSPVKAAEAVGTVPSFGWPVHGRVIAGFGVAPNGVQNDGIDVSVPQGTPIKAADDGVVAYAGNELKGYGNLVLIRHSDGFVTAYAHASEILVKRGQTVKRGEVIAKAGDTGSVKTPELHFEIRKGATPVDPAQFLNGA